MWIDDLEEFVNRGAPCVLVTVAEAKGSTPREAGARMVVGGDRIAGTVGGGRLEYESIRIARAMLDAAGGGPATRVEEFPLGPRLGQCCGGHATLLFETVGGTGSRDWMPALAGHLRGGGAGVVVSPLGGAAAAAGRKLVVTRGEVWGSLGDAHLDARSTAAARDLLEEEAPPAVPAPRRRPGTAETPELLFAPVLPAEFHVVLFGAGHVGKALCAVLAGLPCRITWVDQRAGQFPAAVPGNVGVRVSGEPVQEVDRAPGGAYFLVMTHSHALDLALSERILRRGDFAWFGLMGSASKRKRFEKRLLREGIPAAVFARTACPVGVEGIDAKHPGAVAVAVAAQVLQARERAAARLPATRAPQAEHA